MSIAQSKEVLLSEFLNQEKLIFLHKLLDGHIIFSGLFHFILRFFYPHDGAVGDILFVGYNEFPETISSWIQL